MNDNQCTKGGCSGFSAKCLISVLATFVVLVGFNWWYHGVYLMPKYQETAALWRPMAEMQELAWVCYATKLVMALAIACLYKWISKNAACGGKCPKTGAKFGFKIGLLLGAHDFASFIWLPLGADMTLPLKWAAGDVVMGVLVGVVLSFVARLCSKDKGECSAKK